MNITGLIPIHLPDPVSWWPPAPGWWLLPALALALLLALRWLLPRLKRRSLRRQSLDSFNSICAAHREGQAPQQTLRDFAALLRRILISYRGREAAGACTGAEWIAAIRELAPGVGFDEQQLELLVRDRYRTDCDYDIERLLACAETWIRALPREANRAAA